MCSFPETNNDNVVFLLVTACEFFKGYHNPEKISLQSRRFLTKTRRYTDRGRHIEKQRKRLRGRGGEAREAFSSPPPPPLLF